MCLIMLPVKLPFMARLQALGLMVYGDLVLPEGFLVLQLQDMEFMVKVLLVLACMVRAKLMVLMAYLQLPRELPMGFMVRLLVLLELVCLALAANILALGDKDMVMVC